MYLLIVLDFTRSDTVDRARLIDWLIMEALNIAIFGINVTAVSLHVGIANIFVFRAIWVRLHPDFTLVDLRTLRRLSKFFGQEGHPSPPIEVRRCPYTYVQRILNIRWCISGYYEQGTRKVKS